MNGYLPEGERIDTADNAAMLGSMSALEETMRQGLTAEAVCTLCDSGHNLWVDLGFIKGKIPRGEGALGIEEGSTRDIALISRVNKPICFKVVKARDDDGYALLSRRAAQEECKTRYLSALRRGDVIPARVTHMEQFGAFVDVGCGLPSLIPIDMISVSRIAHPADRFIVGQRIRAVVRSLEDDKITLSHKELLGTWEENAEKYAVGETVTGIVRSVEGYGIFVELTPNLAGLAELRDGVRPGDTVSVYIKAMIPDKMKIKLIIVDSFRGGARKIEPFEYFVRAGHIDRWLYSVAGCEKVIGTDFTEG
ncbi:MAG: S1 RNA-binding domain-containing protein [Bacteroides sp.]|nr:S1 RNA-binding domain-containing protein [Eubacterium sp.]MCM1419694.1 S1 RNA-binding domain-containing protein [Roseburia sp.]MCM1463692.1 S1 RNA-binding domain-containing protein [Bacteroides sp.]